MKISIIGFHTRVIIKNRGCLANKILRENMNDDEKSYFLINFKRTLFGKNFNFEFSYKTRQC